LVIQALVMYANGLSRYLSKQWSRLHSTDLYVNFVIRICNKESAVLLNILLAIFIAAP